MIRAFFTALFVLMFVRFAVWAARLLTGGRRGEGSGSVGRRPSPRRVSPGEIVDVPFTEVPPPESTKRM